MNHRGPAPAATWPPAISFPGAPATRHMAAIALVALIGTGCANAPAAAGGGGDGERPAAGGSTTGETGATPDPATVQRPQKYPPEFSACMRENGVEDFPDPNADGIILYYGDD